MPASTFSTPISKPHLHRRTSPPRLIAVPKRGRETHVTLVTPYDVVLGLREKVTAAPEERQEIEEKLNQSQTALVDLGEYF